MDRGASLEDLRANFRYFSVCFAVNHGVVTTPLVIATSTLNSKVGYTGNALLNLFTVASALVLGAPLVQALGPRRALACGMMLYCIYVGLFLLAGLRGGEGQLGLQYAAFCIGSACAGCGAGVLWTAQGAYFARTVDEVLRLEDEELRTDEEADPLLRPGTEKPLAPSRAVEDDAPSRARLSAELSATFAVRYLGLEVAAKLLWSGLAYAGLRGWIAAAIYLAIGVASTVYTTRVRDLSADATAADPWTAKLKAAAGLWGDPAVWLLAGSNLTFGFSAAFMNGYVNANFTAPQLGTFAVAMLAALTTLAAGVLSMLLGPLAAAAGKGPTVTLGAAAFLCLALCPLILGCCARWHWWLVVLYLLQGAGRAVYESANKGVFVDFFPGGDSVGAFANCMLQTSLAFAICFFLSEWLSGLSLEIIIVVLAVATPCGYALASHLRVPRTIGA